jgi:hypothetical protein
LRAKAYQPLSQLLVFAAMTLLICCIVFGHIDF